MKSRFLFSFCLMAAVLTSSVTRADDASDLNNLQRQIEAAKAAKRSKSAAAAPANPAPKGARQDANALHMANLTVQSDASCVLSVNGEKKVTLSAGVSSVKVPSGKNLLTCSSTEYPGIVFSGEAFARAGENSVYYIKILEKREAAEREAMRAWERVFDFHTWSQQRAIYEEFIRTYPGLKIAKYAKALLDGASVFQQSGNRNVATTYQMLCAICHSDNSKELARPLDPHRLMSLGSNRISKIIKYGTGGGMPEFDVILTEEEITNLADYLVRQ